MLDLCEESVNAALLVGFPAVLDYLLTLTRATDILVVPNVSTRSLRESTIRVVQNM